MSSDVASVATPALPVGDRATCAVEALDAELVRSIAAGIAASPLWRDAVAHDPHVRDSVRLVETEHYEVWVIAWWPGQSVELHDHGNSVGAFVVVEGELVEVVAEAPQELHRQVVRAGGSRIVPVGRIHDVLNLSSAPATSIHVYSPPLSTMTHYDPVTLEQLRHERYQPGDAVYGPGDAARALHPARGPRA